MCTGSRAFAIGHPDGAADREGEATNRSGEAANRSRDATRRPRRPQDCARHHQAAPISDLWPRVRKCPAMGTSIQDSSPKDLFHGSSCSDDVAPDGDAGPPRSTCGCRSTATRAPARRSVPGGIPAAVIHKEQYPARITPRAACAIAGQARRAGRLRAGYRGRAQDRPGARWRGRTQRDRRR